MLSATFHNWGGGPHQVHGHFPTPEILYIIHRNCYTSQGDPDFSFPYQTSRNSYSSDLVSIIPFRMEFRVRSLSRHYWRVQALMPIIARLAKHCETLTFLCMIVLLDAASSTLGTAISAISIEPEAWNMRVSMNLTSYTLSKLAGHVNIMQSSRTLEYSSSSAASPRVCHCTCKTFHRPECSMPLVLYYTHCKLFVILI